MNADSSPVVESEELPCGLDDHSPLPPGDVALLPIEKEAIMHIAGETVRRRKKKGRPYSTTSSVYAEHTLSNPDNDQVIYW
jgi:hypothetical protein